tara:strand:- start:112 stop:369 length:258 start_codon:yes stop_codon:yes gene_type:complete
VAVIAVMAPPVGNTDMALLILPKLISTGRLAGISGPMFELSVAAALIAKTQALLATILTLVELNPVPLGATLDAVAVTIVYDAIF